MGKRGDFTNGGKVMWRHALPRKLSAISREEGWGQNGGGSTRGTTLLLEILTSKRLGKGVARGSTRKKKKTFVIHKRFKSGQGKKDR